MRQSRFARLLIGAAASALSLAMPAILPAQARVIKVVSSDGEPIAHANVTVEGGIIQVTDDSGLVSLGAGKRQTFTVRVRRIGFTQWFGQLEVPDTAATLTIALPSLAQKLSTVRVSGEAKAKSPLAMTGFYDRWLMRQKGVLSAVFISPEELDFRHPDRITAMLYGLNGVRVSQACVSPPVKVARGTSCLMGQVAFSTFVPGNCPMAIVIDGMQQHPLGASYVGIDNLLDAYSVAAMEVYSRGGNMPVNFQFQDTECGVLAFWTGSRRP
jgi:hypothetical protein